MSFEPPKAHTGKCSAPPAKYALSALGIALFLVGTHVYLALTPANSFLDWFRFDDAFYYYKTAQNIVAGRGVTFDGTGPTNGFHPLWMVLLLPLFAASRGDGILALRLVLGVIGLLLAGMVWVFYREGRCHFGEAAPLIVLALGLLWPTGYMTIVAGGMESALSVLTLVGFWAALAAMRRTRREDDPRAVALVGLTAALAMTARLDNALVVAVVGLVLLYRWWRAGVPWARRIRLALAYGLPGLVGVGGFLVWSRLYVGTWMPISSQVKTWWGALHDTPYGRAFRYTLLSFLAAFRGKPLAQWPDIWARYRVVAEHAYAPTLLPLLAGLLFGGMGVRWMWRRYQGARMRLQGAALDWLTLGAGFHLLYMKFLAGISPLRDWYWTPEIVTGMLGVSALLGMRFAPRTRTAWARAWAVAVWGVFLLFAAHFAWWLGSTFPLHNARLHLYLHRARWVEAHTEPGSVVGAAGSGTLGYFVQGRTVLNLDGLISTPAYFQALKAGNAAAYLAHHGLRYVVGGFWITKMEPYASRFGKCLDTVEEYKYAGYEAWLYRFLPDECPR